MARIFFSLFKCDFVDSRWFMLWVRNLQVTAFVTLRCKVGQVKCVSNANRAEVVSLTSFLLQRLARCKNKANTAAKSPLCLLFSRYTRLSALIVYRRRIATINTIDRSPSKHKTWKHWLGARRHWWDTLQTKQLQERARDPCLLHCIRVHSVGLPKQIR